MGDAERLLRQLTVPDHADGPVAKALEDGVDRLISRERMLSFAALGLLFPAAAGGLVALAFGGVPLAVAQFAAAVAAVGWLVWDVWASRYPWWADSTRVARGLCRRGRWRALPAAYLRSDILAHAGLHRRVAATLGDDMSAARTASALVVNGFSGDVSALITTVKAVLLPAA